MKVTVEYFAQAREAVGLSREPFETAQGSTLSQFLHQIATQKGAKLSRWLLTPDGTISPSLAVAVNEGRLAQLPPFQIILPG